MCMCCGPYFVLSLGVIILSSLLSYYRIEALETVRCYCILTFIMWNSNGVVELKPRVVQNGNIYYLVVLGRRIYHSLCSHIPKLQSQRAMPLLPCGLWPLLCIYLCLPVVSLIKAEQQSWTAGLSALLVATVQQPTRCCRCLRFSPLTVAPTGLSHHRSCPLISDASVILMLSFLCA